MMSHLKAYGLSIAIASATALAVTPRPSAAALYDSLGADPTYTVANTPMYTQLWNYDWLTNSFSTGPTGFLLGDVKLKLRLSQSPAVPGNSQTITYVDLFADTTTGAQRSGDS